MRKRTTLPTSRDNDQRVTSLLSRKLPLRLLLLKLLHPHSHQHVRLSLSLSLLGIVMFNTHFWIDLTVAEAITATHPGTFMRFVPSRPALFTRSLNDDGSVSLLCRYEFSSLLRRLSSRKRVVMLQGAGGVGKTVLLRLLAEYYRQQEGYTVIHLEANVTDPRSLLVGALSNRNFAPDTDLRREITEAVANPKCSLGTRAQLALEILDWLSSNTRVAVLIDHYNEFFDRRHQPSTADPDDQKAASATWPYIDKMRHFSHTALPLVENGGVFVAAVSSSSTSLGTEAFTDDLRNELTMTIDVLSDQERSTWLSWHRERHLLSDEVSDQEICAVAAHVPRMLWYFDRRNVFKLMMPGHQHLTRAASLSRFTKCARDYYQHQVYMVLLGEASYRRALSAADSRDAREHHQLLVSLIRHDRIGGGVFHLPNRWRSSGMFIATPDQQAWQLVCPPARDAIVWFCHTHLGHSIEILAAESTGRWDAFELVFTAEFLGHKVLKIPNQDFQRKRREPPTIVMTTNSFKRVTFPTDDHSTIEPGTVVVPDNVTHDFGVIDFFAYTIEGLRVFIKLSQSSVCQHATNVADLFKARDDLGGESVFQYFAKRTNIKVKARAKSLPPGFLCVYACNKEDNVEHRELSRAHKKQVIYLTKRELQKLGGFFAEDMIYSSSSS
mgnify:CR=1 FL=1